MAAYRNLVPGNDMARSRIGPNHACFPKSELNAHGLVSGREKLNIWAHMSADPFHFYMLGR